MRCTDEEDRFGVGRWALLAQLCGLAVLFAGCAVPTPQPAPAPPILLPLPPVSPLPPLPSLVEVTQLPPEPERSTSAALAKRENVDLGIRVSLPPAPPVRNWDDFRKMAARRMVAASPKASYMTKPQPLLFGIPILEIELNSDGSVRDMLVTRPPANIDAKDTIEYAMEAVMRGAPYGNVALLPKPWKFTEVFLFNDKRQFKPRSLD